MSTIAFVLFQDANGAAAALKPRTHTLRNGKFKVLPADSWHQPEKPEKTAAGCQFSRNQRNQRSTKKLDAKLPAAASNEFNIMSLDDDCLLAILSHLSIEDLCVVAPVCPRLRQNAEIEFRKRFKNLSLGTEQTIKQIKTILSNFGHLVKELLTPYDCFNTFKSSSLLDLFIRYCSGTLEKLTLSQFLIQGKSLNRSKMLFQPLKSLTLIDCKLSMKMRDAFASCHELISLKLDSCEEDYKFYYDLVFPKLETFSINFLTNIKLDKFKRFCQLHPHLKNLEISKCDFTNFEFCEVIGENLKNLEELRMDPCAVQAELRHLLSLTKLKVLKVDCWHTSADKFLSDLVESEIDLEYLDLTRIVISEETINILCQMTNLKTLSLEGSLSDEFLLNLAKKLPNLMKITLSGKNKLTIVGVTRFIAGATKLKEITLRHTDLTITDIDYKGIADVIVRRASPLSLDFEYTNRSGFLNVSSELIKEHKSLINFRSLFSISLSDMDSDSDFDFEDDYDTDFDSDSDFDIDNADLDFDYGYLYNGDDMPYYQAVFFNID